MQQYLTNKHIGFVVVEYDMQATEQSIILFDANNMQCSNQKCGEEKKTSDMLHKQNSNLQVNKILKYSKGTK